MIPLSGQDDVLLVMGSSREASPTKRQEEAQRETLAAACWLMPSLSPALIAEALELGADQSSRAVDPAGALSADTQ